MADRRSDEAPAVDAEVDAAPESRSSADAPAPDLTERIKAAYAATTQRGDDTQTGGRPVADRPGSRDRLAAALAGRARNEPDSAPQVRPDAPEARMGSTAAAPKQAPGRKVRRARLRLTHVDPWSVMKTSFLLSIALGIVTVVAVGIVWSVLGAAGVWDSIDSAVSDVVGDTGTQFQIEDYLGMSRVMGFTMIVAVVDVVLVTVIATLGAFLYNLAAALLGGLEVVLAEEDH